MPRARCAALTQPHPARALLSLTTTAALALTHCTTHTTREHTMTTNNPQPAPRKRLDEYVGENAQPLPVRGGKRNVKRRSAKSGDPRADRARSEKREV